MYYCDFASTPSNTPGRREQLQRYVKALEAEPFGRASEIAGAMRCEHYLPWRRNTIAASTADEMYRALTSDCAAHLWLGDVARIHAEANPDTLTARVVTRISPKHAHYAAVSIGIQSLSDVIVSTNSIALIMRLTVARLSALRTGN